MFLGIEQVKESLKRLEVVQPFFGLTFLVFKKNELRVDSTFEFPINAENKKFLDEFYKPARESTYYYRVFRTSDKNKHWIASDYPYSGLQAINTQTFGKAFTHPTGSDIWGWAPDYVKTLKSKLYRGKPIPAFHLAVWLYREREWQPGTTAEEIVKTFLDEFFITEDEKQELFDLSVPEISDQAQLFQDQKISWEELRAVIGLPEDAPPEEGGTLAYLELQGIGPARQIFFEPAPRLNLITGDNGLGKTFLLECAWWALTGQWAGLPAYRREDAKPPNEPKITFQISGKSSGTDSTTVVYDWQTQSWPSRKEQLTIPGLLIYARLDGSFAVWDPAKSYWSSSSVNKADDQVPQVFSREEVWNGRDVKVEGKTKTFINGLLRDWVEWQNTPEESPFNTFKKVLKRLSPPTQSDLGSLEPGKPVRLIDDAKRIPTLKHPYGEVPIVHASAGVRRIITIAYLIVWAWEEHKIQSGLLRREPEKRIVIQIDEIEEHLHPQWQRRILPALLDVSEELDPSPQVQFLVATHSPLVLASVEAKFDSEIDKLFHLDIVPKDLFESEVELVELEEIPFYHHGPVDHWLMSDVFELRHARSLEAEAAIESAIALQLQDEPKPEEVKNVSDKLMKYLADDDEFWPRWKYFAEQHGVRFDSYPSTT